VEEELNGYNVQFVGDYFTMDVSVDDAETDEDKVISLASEIIKYYYGFDVSKVSNEINIESR
jgi:hypothetical protein